MEKPKKIKKKKKTVKILKINKKLKTINTPYNRKKFKHKEQHKLKSVLNYFQKQMNIKELKIRLNNIKH